MLYTLGRRGSTRGLDEYVYLCHLLSDAGRRPLRSHSNDIRKLLVPRTHNKLGDRSFSAAGPRLWNELPPGLRRPGLSFDSFRRSLKTHLFGNWSAYWLFSTYRRYINKFIYLSIYLYGRKQRVQEWNTEESGLRNSGLGQGSVIGFYPCQCLKADDKAEARILVARPVWL